MKNRVNLWFARNIIGEIVEVKEACPNSDYSCPICSSKVIPKALDSSKVVPHFAHIDAEKCSSESMIHWWFKNKFIEVGDRFSILIESEEETYQCIDYEVEPTYHLRSGRYNPDLLVKTSCGRDVIFEFANTNKKSVEEYSNKWIELDKTIVEVDIKNLIDGKRVFPPLFHNGKSYNHKRGTKKYWDSIGSIKEKYLYGDYYDSGLAKKLDDFWRMLCENKSKKQFDDDILRKVLEVDEHLSAEEFKSVLRASQCIDLKGEYLDYKIRMLKKALRRKAKSLGANMPMVKIEEEDIYGWNKLDDIKFSLRVFDYDGDSKMKGFYSTAGRAESLKIMKILEEAGKRLMEE